MLEGYFCSNNVLSKFDYFERTLIRKNEKKKNSNERNSKEKKNFERTLFDQTTSSRRNVFPPGFNPPFQQLFNSIFEHVPFLQKSKGTNKTQNLKLRFFSLHCPGKIIESRLQKCRLDLIGKIIRKVTYSDEAEKPQICQRNAFSKRVGILSGYQLLEIRLLDNQLVTTFGRKSTARHENYQLLDLS